MLHGDGWNLINLIFLLILSWIGIIIFFTLLIKIMRNNGMIDYPAGSAQEIAKTRYAKGEISREEYLALMQDLNFQQVGKVKNQPS